MSDLIKDLTECLKKHNLALINANYSYTESISKPKRISIDLQAVEIKKPITEKPFKWKPEKKMF